MKGMLINMINILYISNTSPLEKTGTSTNSTMHNKMISAIPDHKVYSIHITSSEIEENDTTIKIKKGNKIEKIKSVLNGYPPIFNMDAKKKAFKIIKEKHISIVYVESSVFGKFIEDIKKEFPMIKVIAFFHDIEVRKMKEDNECDLSFGRKMALPIYFSNERKTVKFADAVIVLNERDKKIFIEEYGKVPDAIVPICVPIPTVSCKDKHYAGKKLKLLFVGVKYGPNLNGIRWFIKEVIPKITCPYEFNIVGRKMEEFREEFEGYSSNINVVGTVDDLSDYYNDADIIVGPISDGGGMKVKTAEALSYGKTFIGRTESLEGYWDGMSNVIKNQKIFRTDDASEFANLIDSFYQMEYDKNDINIKNWAKKNYSFESNYEIFLALFKKLENSTNKEKVS